MPRRILCLCFAFLLCSCCAQAQTLAHPGWHGNGIAAEAWWKRAAFIEFGADTTFAQAAATLDAVSEAGADSIILPDLLPAGAATADADGISHPFAAKFGTEDDLDALLREASARRMHVVLRADLLRLAASAGELRFWMSRGIAGFDLGDVPPAQVDTLQLLRGAMDRFPGKRVLLAHVPDGRILPRGETDPVTLHLLRTQETPAPANAVEIATPEALTLPLPPSAVLVIHASLLANAETRVAVKQMLATRTSHAKSYTSGRSRRSR